LNVIAMGILNPRILRGFQRVLWQNAKKTVQNAFGKYRRSSSHWKLRKRFTRKRSAKSISPPFVLLTLHFRKVQLWS